MTNSITGTNFDLATYRPLLTTDPNFTLYERFKQGSNPYALYNNQDRFLNAIHRGWTTGGLAALQQSNSNKLPQNIGAIYYFGPPSSEDATFQYEKQTNMMSQYFWASTALLGIGYSLNLETFGAVKDGKSDTTQVALASLALTRSVIIAGLETMLLVTNGFRWSDSLKPLIQGDTLSATNLKEATYQAKIKLIRGQVGTFASFAFTANAVISLAMAGVSLDLARQKGDTAQIISQGLSVVSAGTNVIANTFKGLNGIGGLRGWSTSVNRNLGIAGSAFGLVNSLASIGSIGALLSNPKLTPEQRGVLIAEMSVQVLGGTTQALSNLILALNSASFIKTGAAILGPALGAAAAGLLLAMSPLEIYGLVKQSQYADKLDELGKEMGQYGYDGDSMLASLYRDKTGAEGGIMATTTTLGLVGSATAIACAVSVVGAPVAVIVGVVTGALGGILKGIQQPIIEKIARDYAQKIRDQGGSYVFFGKNLDALHLQLIQKSSTKSFIRQLQDDFGVESVIGITTTLISKTALELSAITSNAADLVTSNAYIDRFVIGNVNADRALTLDINQGLINLGAGQIDSKQLLTFLTPLVAPGTEHRVRVQTSKNSYYTSLEVISRTNQWSITDGDASTTMDLRGIVTKLLKSDGSTQFHVATVVNAGAGDDVIIANASALTVDGGAGNDTVSYGGLDGDISIVVTPTQNGFSVNKLISNFKYYKESVGTQDYSYGKRTETVSYREIALETNSSWERITDTLVNVENIFGGKGNDSITGNDDNNVIRSNEGNDTINGGAGNDILLGGDGSDTIDGGDGNDLIMQDMYWNNDTIDGGMGTDTIDYTSTDLTPSHDDQTGHTGILANLSTGKIQKYRGYYDRGLDTVKNIENITGTSLNDSIVGDASNNQLVGGAGNDVLVGAAGNDVLAGGADNDSIDGGVGNDLVLQELDTANDWLNGGEGVDTLDYSSPSSVSSKQTVTSVVTPNIGNGVDVNLTRGTSYKFGYRNSSPGVDTINNFENVVGSSLRDTLVGDAGNNVIFAGLGDDSVEGGVGNDVLSGGMGTDRVSGGEGDDLVLQDIEAVNDTLDGGAGIDTLEYSGTTFSSDALLTQNFQAGNTGWNTDYVLQPLTADAATVFVTTLAPNWGFTTRAGASGSTDKFLFVNGGTSADYAFWKQDVTLVKGETYHLSVDVNSSGATPAKLQLNVGGIAIPGVVNAGAANGWIHVSFDFNPTASGLQTIALRDTETALSDNDFAVDNIVLTQVQRTNGINVNLNTGVVLKYLFNRAEFVWNGVDTISNFENITATSLNDTIWGDAKDNVLNGGDGNDLIDSGAGNNVLSGGDGNDYLTAGDGDDLLSGGTGIDTILAGKGNDLILQDIEGVNDTINGGDGIDTLDYSATMFSTDALLTQDFEYGMTGWTTDYVLQPLTADAATVFVTTLAPNWGFTTRAGASGSTDKFLVVNGGTSADYAFWKQDVTLVKGETYHLSVDLNSSGSTPAKLQLNVGGIAISGVVNAGAANGWIHVSFDFNPTASGLQTIALRDNETAPYGNDFAVDNIALTKTRNTGVTIDLTLGTGQKYGDATMGVDAISGIENVIGTAFSDTLVGNASDNMLTGDDGNDTLSGGYGNDILSGGGGNDRVDGGDGADLIRQNIDKTNDVLDGGSDVDTVDYSDTLFSKNTLLTQTFESSTMNWGTDYVLKNQVGGVLGAVAVVTQTPGGWGFSSEFGISKSTDKFLMVDGATDSTLAFWKQDATLVKGESYRLSMNVNSTNWNSANFQLYIGGVAIGSSVSAGGSNGWIKVDFDFVATTTATQNLALKDLTTADNGNDFAIDNITLSPTRTVGVSVNLAQGVARKYGDAIYGIDALSHIENVIGTSLNDILIGDVNANVLASGDGNDVLTGAEGDDVLTAGLGDDIVNGGAGNDVLSGGNGVDTINGGDDNDMIAQNFEAVNDTIDGGSGVDTVDYSLTDFTQAIFTEDFESATYSWTSDYVLRMQYGGVLGAVAVVTQTPNNPGLGFMATTGIAGITDKFLIVDGATDATLAFWKQDATLIKGEAYRLSMNVNSTSWHTARFQLFVNGVATGNAVSAGEGNGWMTINFDFVSTSSEIQNITLKDLQTADDGNDFAIDNISIKSTRGTIGALGVNVNLEMGTAHKYGDTNVGIDTLRSIEGVIGTTLNDIIVGDANNNELSGNEGNDNISGGDGNDALAGGQGTDILSGGNGDDLFLQDVEAVNDTIDGGTGVDTVDYSATPFTQDALLTQDFESSASNWGTDYAIAKSASDGIVGSVVVVNQAPEGWFNGRTGINGITDKFLLIDGATNSSLAFWKQDAVLVKGERYHLSMSVNATRTNNACFQLYINGVADGASISPLSSSGWQMMTFDFVATVSGVQNIALKDVETSSSGNDFAVDIITLTSARTAMGVNVNLAVGTGRKYGDLTAGIDTLTSIENVTGTTLNDTLIGNSSDNILSGGAGNDVINGASGDDVLAGGSGNDTIEGGTDNDVLSGGTGTDTLNGGDGNDMFMQDVEGVSDTLDGGAGEDTVNYSGTIFTQDALLTQDFESGNFDWSSDYVSRSQVGGILGAVAVVKQTPNGWGFSSSTGMNGATDNFLMVDGATNSNLALWKQYATLTKGERYRLSMNINSTNWNSASFQLYIDGIATGNAVSAGGSNGWVTIYFDFIATSSATQNLALKDLTTADNGNDFAIDNIALTTLRGTLGVNINLAVGTGRKYDNSNYGIDTLRNIENATGSSLNDTIIGDGNNNILDGGEGNDTLDGGAGNDALQGGLGNDTLMGGAGNDLLSGESGTDSISGGDGNDLILQDIELVNDTIDGGSGIDTIDYSVTTMTNGSRPLMGSTGIVANLGQGRIEKYHGYNSDIFDTVRGVENIVGTALNDTLIGDANNNKLAGGDGNDTYFVDNVGDTVIEISNQGIDTVNASINWTLDSNIENLNLTGSTAINGTGNELNNSITGNSGNNVLDGDLGNNTIYGGQGNDTIIGGAGYANFYDGGDGSDTVDYSNNAARVYSMLNADAGSGFNSSGGGAYTNFVDGNSTDWHRKDDFVGIENLIGSKYADVFVGNAEANRIDGGAGDDRINGMGGDDTLLGGDGNNTIYGGQGNDTIIGGAGFANFYDGGDGNDTVDYSSNGACVGAALAADSGWGFYSSGGGAYTYFQNGVDWGRKDNFVGIENLIGSRFADTLSGNSDANRLDGGAGNDNLFGGAGDDTLLGGEGNDTLDGGTGNNTIYGGQGNDTIIGGAGYANFYDGGDGSDTVDYSNNAARVYSMLNADAGSGFNSSGGGAYTNFVDGNSTDWHRKDDFVGIENLIGSKYADVFVGNAEANRIDGGAGDDTISGGEGNDTYIMKRGNSADLITDIDTTIGNTDTLSFINDVNSSQLWFEHIGNNLKVSIDGTRDSATIQNWYSGTSNQIENITTSDGKTLLNTDVNKLVQAMASFTPPASGQTTLSTSYQASLSTVIAANWH